MSGIKNHEIHVAGKNLVVDVCYIDHVVSKDGKSSLLDFSNLMSAASSIIVIFLESKLVFQEDLIVNGVYHAMMDKYEHGKKASDNPATNILMHMFGTNQIDVIKQLIVPSSYHNPGAENNGVALVLVSDRGNPTSRDVFFSSFSQEFSYERLLPPGVPVPLHADVVRAWTLHKDVPASIHGGSADVTKTLARIARARMALFSLNMQQKL